MNELRGRIVNILKEESGVSKSGKNWVKQNFVIETEGQYSKKICLSLFGDKTDMIQSKSIGDEVEVKFDIESKEYNGKWFTNVNAYSVNLVRANNESGLPPSESITHEEQYKRAVDVETVVDYEDTGLPF